MKCNLRAFTWTLTWMLPGTLPPLLAQTPNLLQDVRAEHLPGAILQLLVADFDGDGLDDLIVDGRRLWLNRSSARFADVTAQSLPIGGRAILVALDADRDGDVDLLTDGMTLLRNNGRAVFSAVANGAFDYTPITAGDFDGDGDLDVLAARLGAQIGMLRNDGSGGLTLASFSSSRLSNPPRGLVADFDRDGDLDVALVLSQVDQFEPNLGLNNGSGGFSWSRGLANGFARACDLDGDRDIDLVSGTLALINDGQGGFADEAAQRYPRRVSTPMVDVDVDLDGDQDLVLAVGETWINDGRGLFGAVTVADLSRDNLRDLATARVDADRFVDLVAVPGRVFLARGAGRFDLLDPAALGDRVQAVQIADLTGDGDLDVLERVTPTHGYRTRRNDGSGFFVPLPVSSTGSFVQNVAREAIGDVDRDGDLDLVASFGGNGYNPLLFTNQGTGVFAAPRALGYAHQAVPIELLLDDLDGDGDLDLLDVGTDGVVLARNDGSGNFTSTGLVWAGFTTVADYADLDGDGDRDLVVAQDRLTVLENRQGAFVDATAQFFATPPSGFGRPVVVSVAGSTWLLWPRVGVVDVYERVGASFQLRPALGFSFRGDVVGARRLSQVGGVTRLQLARRVESFVVTIEIWEFDGVVLTDVTSQVLPGTYASLAGSADLDTDGDLDVVAVDADGRAAVLRGTARGLRSRYAPLVGGSLELALRDGSATPSRSVLAIGVLGAPSRLPVPGLGLLRVDLSLAAVLPIAATGSPAEIGVNIPVPANVGLRDVEVGVQFVHAAPSAALALGPLARAVVR